MRKKRLKKIAPTPLMDIDPRVRARLETESIEYTDVLDLAVPISRIKLREAWNKFRSKNNLRLIKATGAVPPVFLFLDEKSQTYRISDGIHRIHAVKKLGFTHIPAVVSRKRKRG